jgi:hypothetical protein
MQPPNGIEDILSFELFGVVIKLLFIFLQFVYIFYAFMLTRQVKIMNRSFNTPAAPLFESLAFFHFIGALVIVIVTIFFS